MLMVDSVLGGLHVVKLHVILFICDVGSSIFLGGGFNFNLKPLVCQDTDTLNSLLTELQIPACIYPHLLPEAHRVADPHRIYPLRTCPADVSGSCSSQTSSSGSEGGREGEKQTNKQMLTSE